MNEFKPVDIELAHGKITVEYAALPDLLNIFTLAMVGMLADNITAESDMNVRYGKIAGQIMKILCKEGYYDE